MGSRTVQRGIVERQFGVIARWQLLERGYSPRSIKHWMKKRWLHAVFRGVYAVGRPELSRYGWWMAAVLASGPDAVIDGDSAAALWGCWAYRSGLSVSVPTSRRPRNRGIRVHRRAHVDATELRGIPVTSITATLIDFAAAHPPSETEAALNEADVKKLIKLKALREELEGRPRTPGLGKLKRIIDVRAFSFTRSELERAFKPIARAAGMPEALTRVHIRGREFDFYFHDLGLVVETDGGTFHRTPFKQADDARRSNGAALSGLTLLRFTHGQIRYERAYVLETLKEAAGAATRG